MGDRPVIAANHQAVSAIGSPDAATDAGVKVMNATRVECLGAPNIVDVVRVPAIDDDVA